jgi:hypothetical protein
MTVSFISNRFLAGGLLIALMIEAIRASVTSVNSCQSKWRYSSEDSHLSSVLASASHPDSLVCDNLALLGEILIVFVNILNCYKFRTINQILVKITALRVVKY